MGSEQKKGPLTEEELTLRLSYFSRQCWHQRHLFSHQNAALRQRIADQDAQLKDAHDRLRDAHSRLQEVTAYLGQTFQQLQDVMAARIAAELKLAGYGLLESSSSLDLDFKVGILFIILMVAYDSYISRTKASPRVYRKECTNLPLLRALYVCRGNCCRYTYRYHVFSILRGWMPHLGITRTRAAAKQPERSRGLGMR